MAEAGADRPVAAQRFALTYGPEGWNRVSDKITRRFKVLARLLRGRGDAWRPNSQPKRSFSATMLRMKRSDTALASMTGSEPMARP